MPVMSIDKDCVVSFISDKMKQYPSLIMGLEFEYFKQKPAIPEERFPVEVIQISNYQLGVDEN